MLGAEKLLWKAYILLACLHLAASERASERWRAREEGGEEHEGARTLDSPLGSREETPEAHVDSLRAVVVTSPGGGRERSR